jgi:hypothetical protein
MPVRLAREVTRPHQRVRRVAVALVDECRPLLDELSRRIPDRAGQGSNRSRRGLTYQPA